MKIECHCQCVSCFQMTMISPKIVIFYLFIGVSLAQQLTNDDPKFDARISQVLAKNVLQLAQEIGTTVLQDSDKQTEIFSPLSIYTVLSMIMMGSNGQTFQELMTLLKINNGESVLFGISPAIELKFSISDSYLANNSWKVHEEFGLLIEDLARDMPHPLHNRPHDFWQTHRRLTSNFASRPIDDGDPRSFQTISVANGIFMQNGYSIRPDYRDAIQSTYKSTLQRLDFFNKSDLSTRYINR